MISFEEAKKLIREGKFFDVKLINFDINQLDIEVTTDSHDSNSFENIYTYTTQKTLLHIAIECKNKKAIIGLIKNGANKKLDVEKTEKRVQRQAISGNSFWGAAEWGEWQDWEPSITTLSTVQLAEDTKHPEIISIIKDGDVQQTVSSNSTAISVPHKAPSALSRKGLSAKGKLSQQQLIEALPQDKTWDFGEAIDNGDCFYDAIAQSLRARAMDSTHTIKSLREICSNYIYQLNAQSPQANWVNEAIAKDKGIDDYQAHLTTVQFTQEEMTENKKGYCKVESLRRHF